MLCSAGALVAALVLALAAGGCGGGSSGDESAASAGKATTIESSSLSKEEFVEKANAICARGKAKGFAAISAYLKQHKGGGIEQANGKLLGEAAQKAFLPSIQRQVDQIRALGAPEGEEQEVEAILTALEDGVQKTQGQSYSSARFSQAFSEAGKLAGKYGLTNCAYA